MKRYRRQLAIDNPIAKRRSGAHSTFVITIGIAVLSSGCHPQNARDRCDEMTQRLYEARKESRDHQLRALLTSDFVTNEQRDALVSAIRAHDSKYGLQQSRRRYLSNVAHKSEVGEDWFLARIGYQIRYPGGETREDVICRVDLAGRNGVIIGVEFGASPSAK